jgi:large subunit ribosomal protein L35
MPKLKTKSSCKKRFRFTATGKVIMPQKGKRHGMRKRSNSFIRKARGTTVMDETDQHRIVQYMPYGNAKK